MKKLKIKKQILEKKKIKNEDYKIAFDFATKAYKQFREVIKAIVLFGSVAKEEQIQKSDIDLIIIIDDCAIQWDQELIAWYREELTKLIAKQKYRKKLHINTVTLSVFWEEIKNGEPVAINVLRYGEALVDFGGFFDPLKLMLARGRIRPTPEAIYTTLKRAPTHVSRARFNVLMSIESLYWGMVDSAHSALMAANQTPPSPEHIAELLDYVFVNNRLLNRKYVDWYEEMRMLAQNIIHGNVKDIKGKEVDDHLAKVDEFIKVMTDLTAKLIKDEKIIRVERR